jgi:hypothetical protein
VPAYLRGLVGRTNEFVTTELLHAGIYVVDETSWDSDCHGRLGQARIPHGDVLHTWDS